MNDMSIFKAQRFVEIYAIVQGPLYEYKVYPSGRVLYWDDGLWWTLYEDEDTFEEVRDAGLKAINEV